MQARSWAIRFKIGKNARPLKLGPARTHGLHNVPKTWVTLLDRTDLRMVRALGSPDRIWLGAHAPRCLRIALPAILFSPEVIDYLVDRTNRGCGFLIPVGLNSTALILRLPKTSAIFEPSDFPVLLGFWFSTSRSIDSIWVSF